MAKNSNKSQSSKRTAVAVRETFSRKAVDDLRKKAKAKGEHKGGTNATLTMILLTMIKRLPKTIGEGENAFSRDEFAKGYTVRAMNSFTGSGDFRLDKRQFQKTMIGIGATGKKEMVALISPACPGGKALYSEKSMVRAANRAATRFDMIIDAIAASVVDIVAGFKLGKPVYEETEEQANERKERNKVISKRRKMVMQELGLFPARARKTGNKDKDGNKVEKVILDFDIMSAYKHEVNEEGKAVCLETKPGPFAIGVWEYMATNGYLASGTIDKDARPAKSDGGRTVKCGCVGCGVTANLAAIDAGMIGCANPTCAREGQALGAVADMTDAELAQYTKARSDLKQAAAA